MKKRCCNKNTRQYHDYGGRGVTYDPKWETFEGFWEDMNVGYPDLLSLDRINPDGNYCIENCRWVTRDIQARNKRTYSNNETGFANIFLYTNKGVPGICCKITKDGESFKKRLSLVKYSFDEAVEILIVWRNSKRKELGFSEYHGL